MTWSIGILYYLDLGSTILQVNLMGTIMSAMGIILMVPFGILSDRWGRKPMLVFLMVMTFFGSLVRTFATNPNHLLLASFIGGLAGGGFFPILLSMLGDIAEPDEQQEAISILFLFSSIGMLIGPIISSFLLTSPQITLRNIFHIDVIAQGVTILYIIIWVRETRLNIVKGEKIEYRVHITELIKQHNFRGLLIMAFLFFFYNSIMGTYIPIYARVNLGLSDARIASFATFRSLTIMLIRFSSATFLARAPVRIFITSALALSGVTGFLTPFTNSYLSMVLILLLSGASFGAIMILGSLLVTVNSTPENRGVANSLYNVAQSIGSMTNLLTSPIVNVYGFASVFFLGGITTLCSTTIPLWLKKISG